MPYGEGRKFREIHTTRNIVICDGRKESHIAKSSLKKIVFAMENSSCSF